METRDSLVGLVVVSTEDIRPSVEDTVVERN